MKVLILGSSGLVGSSINRILSKSKKVSHVFPSTRKDADLFSLDETVSLINSYSPDLIVNSAAKVGGIYANNTKRMDFIIQNLKINMNVFQACVDKPKIKIINLGSSCIYPLNATNPISENSFLTGTLEPTNSPYAIAKIAGIEIGRALNLESGNEIVNLMPTNLYGPNDNFSKTDSHVIPGLIRRMHEAKIEKHNEFKIWGTGKPLREFLFVDDLSKAIDFLIDKKIEVDILNVGSGTEITIKDLAEKIKSVVDYKGELIFDESMPDGNPRKLIDSYKINQLGWEASVTLDEGLRMTYAWFLKNS
ncbi:GDP-L-fucose synthase [Candidatus Actinomarina]|jgi:GDP-L-fucose synthase|nr:GDP-L-fucose synthase [Candidatus Actinomarina sp.]